MTTIPLVQVLMESINCAFCYQGQVNVDTLNPSIFVCFVCYMPHSKTTFVQFTSSIRPHLSIDIEK